MLRKVQQKIQKASAEEAVNSNFLSHMSEHLLKRIKPFRIVYVSVFFNLAKSDTI